MLMPNLTPAQQEEMLSAARAAFKNAHAPYSNFKVGATILTERGTMFSRLQRGERLLRPDDLRRTKCHLRRGRSRREQHED